MCAKTITHPHSYFFDGNVFYLWKKSCTIEMQAVFKMRPCEWRDVSLPSVVGNPFYLGKAFGLSSSMYLLNRNHNKKFTFLGAPKL